MTPKIFLDIVGGHYNIKTKHFEDFTGGLFKPPPMSNRVNKKKMKLKIEIVDRAISRTVNALKINHNQDPSFTISLIPNIFQSNRSKPFGSFQFLYF